MNTKSKDQEKRVWVEVEVNKYTEGITVFRGQMRKADIDAWASGELIDCAIRLEKTYWFLEESLCVLGKGEDHVKHYTGDTFLRADTIMLIFMLKEDSFPSEGIANIDNIFHFPGRTKPS
jgi:hypothetical protein